ncbi:MAG: hypothetical protein JWQ75_229 [Pseudarthrobacter sp.]|nr:hypothetical protein [Pseudarthrobacter sp.]
MLTSVSVGSGRESAAAVTAALGLDFAATPWEYRDADDAQAWQHGAAVDQRWWGTYLMHTRSLAEARALLPLLRSEGKAQRFVLVISSHVPPAAGESWTSRGLKSKAQAAPCLIPGIGFAVVVGGSKWVGVHAAASAALDTASATDSSLALGGLRAGVLEPADRDWLAGDPLASLLTPELKQPEPDDIYAVDAVVGRQVTLAATSGRATPPVWTPGPLDLPPVDVAVINPSGFRPYPAAGTLALTRADLPPTGNLGEPELRHLRDRSYVTVNGADFHGLERPLARRLTQLAVAGVPLLTSNVPPRVEAMVGAPLTDLMARFDAGDPLVLREAKSIDLRRAAFEAYAPIPRWNTVLGALNRLPRPDAQVSILLATRRPNKVAAALAQAAAQSWDALEVVLVLHGFDRDVPEVKRAIEAYPGRLKVLSVPAPTIFGDVLNAGTALASGDYVTKMDDDDWYGRNHVKDLVHAAIYSGADLVGSQVEFVYLESLDITTRRPPAGEQYSDHVAGGTMMLRRDTLNRLGGWRPVHRAVDRCLLQAVQAAGGLVYRTHGQNYLMHRHSAADTHGGHTWNPEDSIFLQSVAEQWDGFSPPPQIEGARDGGSPGRDPALQSFFAQAPTAQRPTAPSHNNPEKVY